VAEEMASNERAMVDIQSAVQAKVEEHSEFVEEALRSWRESPREHHGTSLDLSLRPSVTLAPSGGHLGHEERSDHQTSFNLPLRPIEPASSHFADSERERPFQEPAIFTSPYPSSADTPPTHGKEAESLWQSKPYKTIRERDDRILAGATREYMMPFWLADILDKPCRKSISYTLPEWVF